MFFLFIFISDDHRLPFNLSVSFDGVSLDGIFLQSKDLGFQGAVVSRFSRADTIYI